MMTSERNMLTIFGASGRRGNELKMTRSVGESMYREKVTSYW